MLLFIQPLGGTTQQLASRKHSNWGIDLRMRVCLSSFPPRERKRQDGPSAALLESPKKIRSGVPILVSSEYNISILNIYRPSESFLKCLWLPRRQNLSPNGHRMESAPEPIWRWRMHPVTLIVLALCLVSRLVCLKTIPECWYAEIKYGFGC